MVFKSLLYSSGDAPRLLDEPPECFRDLGLDIVVGFLEKRLDGETVELVRRLWYTPPGNIDDAVYRQEVFADLEDAETVRALRRFVDEFSSIVSLLRHAEEYSSGHQREGMFLGVVLSYIDAVEKLLRTLKERPLRSRGLLSLRDYLESYASSPGFQRLKSRAKEVASLISSVKFCIDIKGSTITVYEKCEGEDYTDIIKSLFERFSVSKDDGEEEPEWRLEYYRGHVEEAILNLAAKIHKKPFEELSRFYREHKNFIDPVLEKLYKEIQFYLSYIDLMEFVREAGLPFTLPRLKEEEGGEEYCIDCFDLSLALKYLKEGREVVTNSFQLGPEERIIVVTGPNSGGKTTFARMVGQVYYLAKLGVPVPGRRAELLFVDAVYTHFPRGEDTGNMRSKLEEELTRMKKILEKATSRSVIIVNEFLSSTSTYDAARLGKKILGMIKRIGSRCIYVTFIDELARLDYVVSYVAQVDPKNPERRTYKVVRQPATGLTYARLIAKKYGLSYEDIVSRVKP